VGNNADEPIQSIVQLDGLQDRDKFTLPVIFNLQ
jgi:hypothetical protein